MGVILALPSGVSKNQSGEQVGFRPTTANYLSWSGGNEVVFDDVQVETKEPGCDADSN